MITKKITNGVYATSVLNPNMRTFDVVMRTENGTSYNSYIVEGTEKIALIETAHLDYFDYFIENIKQITSLEKIEYLVMNHNEPDHSGSISKLLELIPNLKIVTTKAGSFFLKNIVNAQMKNIIIANDGDEIDLGTKTLKFVIAPFLHWSDSMFTYLKQDKLLFSCDFLGSHYCEPQIFDTQISHLDDYESAAVNYFNAIFSPFKPYVQQG
ncbi:MAG: FprA family A-type flavoprotein, partial [Oscillospiraceae bacterium]